MTPYRTVVSDGKNTLHINVSLAHRKDKNSPHYIEVYQKFLSDNYLYPSEDSESYSYRRPDNSLFLDRYKILSDKTLKQRRCPYTIYHEHELIGQDVLLSTCLSICAKDYCKRHNLQIISVL